MICVKSVYGKPEGDCPDPLDNLCNAIILQAVKDLRKARKRLKRNMDDRAAASVVREVSRFFRSQYFCMLSELDGPRLLQRLLEEAA